MPGLVPGITVLPGRDKQRRLDFLFAKAQTGLRLKRHRKAFGTSFPTFLGPVLASHAVAPAPAGGMELAWENTMINATGYRAMAAEHHRLAGMCRSPDSREQHLRLEEQSRVLAEREELLQPAQVPPQASDPRIAEV